MPTLLRTFLGLLIASAALTACYRDNEQDLYPPPATTGCDVSNPTYTVTVAPVMRQSCAYTGCHAGSAPSAGVSLDSYAGVKAAADNGRLMGSITHASGYAPMPQGGPKLDSCIIAGISAWVAAGAQNN